MFDTWSSALLGLKKCFGANTIKKLNFIIGLRIKQWEESEWRVKKIIKDDRQFNYRQCSNYNRVFAWLDQLQNALACEILGSVLKRVPRKLADEHKMNRIGLSLQHLCWYAEEEMFNRIVTAMNHHHSQLKSKCSQWNGNMFLHLVS